MLLGYDIIKLYKSWEVINFDMVEPVSISNDYIVFFMEHMQSKDSY